MEAQQIKLNINELMEGIHDEAFLKACYEAVEGIAKAYRRISGKRNGIHIKPQTEQMDEVLASPILEIKTESLSATTQSVVGEQMLPHDLSLVLLSNQLFKGSEPIAPEASIAFRRALLKTSSSEPILLKQT